MRMPKYFRVVHRYRAFFAVVLTHLMRDYLNSNVNIPLTEMVSKRIPDGDVPRALIQ